MIGAYRDDDPLMYWGKNVAVRRMLPRGPAAELDRGRGPLIQMPVAAMMVTLPLLLPLLLLLLMVMMVMLSSGLRPLSSPPLMVCESSGRRRKAVGSYL